MALKTSYGENIQQYEIQERLGKGGFAVVYKARCLRSGLEVAIKMIDKKLIKKHGLENRVKQEVSIHIRLNHPSVLQLLTFFEDLNFVYLILELCHNGELQRYLRSTNLILSEEEGANIMRQVVGGMLYLHSHRIAHRDLTLANLLLTKDFTVKIADFGLATQLTRNDEKHMTMCGTPNYISPEIATRAPHGLETDVWGLGIMLYTLLVGKAPFDTDEGVRSTLTKVVMSEVKLPLTLSMEARDMINSLLRKNPHDRIKLTGILDHPFLNKNYVSSNNDSYCKKLSTCDSGVSSSYQSSCTPCFTSSPSSNFASNSVPIINGNILRSATTRYTDISESPDYLPFNHSNTNAFRQCASYNLERNVNKFVVLNPVSKSHLEEYKLNSEKFSQPVVRQGSPFLYEAQPYLSSAGVSEFRPNDNACSHNWRTCTQCSHIDSCSCQCSHSHSVNNSHALLNSANYSTKEVNLDQRQCSLKSNSSFHKIHSNVQDSKVHSRASSSKHSAEIAKINSEEEVQKKISIPPINSIRLRAVRQKAKNVIVNILDNGEVCLEFLKLRDGCERVTEVFRVSPDGIRIVIYQLNSGKGVVPSDQPPSVPNEGADAIYSYENIPERHWKKYKFAAKFVDLIKSKTPKVTYYSSAAKCFLMEDGDFEAWFYEGGKITKSKTEVKLLDTKGKSYSFDMTNPQRIPPSDQLMWEHFQKCLKHCQTIENTLEATSTSTDEPCFPVTLGRRPQQYAKDKSL